MHEKDPSLWHAVFAFKCPRCRRGDLFQNRHTYSGNFLKMHRNCQVCGQNYTPEPGFYFGAAYVSYMVSTALAIATFLILFFGFHIRQAGSLIAIIIAIAVMAAPYNFRLSRTVWAYIFIRYRHTH